MILVLSLLTPFTMSNTLSLFHAFRITQTRLMLLSIIHVLNPNVKLKAVLEGCACGAPLLSHTCFSPRIFPFQIVCTSASQTLTIFNPNSTLGRPLITNTAALGNTSSSLTTNLSRPSGTPFLARTTKKESAVHSGFRAGVTRV